MYGVMRVAWWRTSCAIIRGAAWDQQGDSVAKKSGERLNGLEASDSMIFTLILLRCRADFPAMTNLRIATMAVLMLCVLLAPAPGWPTEPLPIEPDLNSRLDELYDHESRMFIMLYSLHGDGKVDYVTGRLVQEYTRSNYGNPVYYTEQFPLFYWWNHTMFNDPDQDGVNGNERVYQEDIEFDIARYKPCVFNGQPC
jgi:hypothetical protein